MTGQAIEIADSKAATSISPAQARRRVVYAGAIGSVVEFYDFGVYGYAATTLAPLFFPSSSATASLLATLAIFALGFIARPIGGIIFGHIGDRAGRKPALALAVIIMALSTFAIGLLPAYAAIGAAAPASLLVMRLLQGLSAGGELGGAASILAETADNDRRGFMTSATQVGALIGLLLASAVVGLLNLVMTPAQFADYGWRLVFILGLPTGLVGLYIRSKLADSPAFERVVKTGEIASVPFLDVLRQDFPAILKAIGLTAVNFAGYYIVFVYLAIYLQTVGTLSRSQATWSTTATLVVAVASLAYFALLSDRFGRKPVIAGAGFGFLVLTLPMFKIMQGDNLYLIVAAQIVLGLCEAAIMGAIWAALVELFPTRVRYSGSAFGYNIAGVLVGGSAPYIATWLVQQTGDKSSPAYFLMAVSVVTLLTLLTVPETAKRNMIA
jgi:MFS transporter, MHS family, proline/betaine transporter